MCRNVNHGGRRCPEADNPVKRRYRRKSSDLTRQTVEKLAGVKQHSGVKLSSPENHKPTHTSQILKIKERLNRSKPDDVTQEVWDAETEVKITELGINIANEAERIADYSQENLDQQIAERYETLLNSLSEDEQDGLNTEQLHLKAEAEIHTEVLQKLTLAYQEVIKNVRNVGGEVAFSSDSSVDGVKIVQETVGNFYPSDWLAEHSKADGDQMVIKTVNFLNERPSYVRSGDVTRGGFIEGEKAEWLKTANLESFDGVKIVNMETVQGDTLTYVVQPDEKHKINLHFMQRQGWEQKSSLNMINDDSTDESISDKVGKKVWVKRNVNSNPTLNVYPPLSDEEKTLVQGTWYEKVAEAYAFHEFGHRMEDVMPNKVIPRLEKAFLMRRSGLNDSTLYQNIEVDNRGEIYVQGGFVNKYVGKLYPEQDNYEVLTTGLEGLYGNNYGGFIGANNVYRAKDDDHRGFVLGLLASV